jgi:hypothetical protein
MGRSRDPGRDFGERHPSPPRNISKVLLMKGLIDILREDRRGEEERGPGAPAGAGWLASFAAGRAVGNPGLPLHPGARQPPGRLFLQKV